jgi:hypothetical protein
MAKQSVTFVERGVKNVFFIALIYAIIAVGSYLRFKQ